jgi:hypothetical protein
MLRVAQEGTQSPGPGQVVAIEAIDFLQQRQLSQRVAALHAVVKPALQCVRTMCGCDRHGSGQAGWEWEWGEGWAQMGGEGPVWPLLHATFWAGLAAVVAASRLVVPSMGVNAARPAVPKLQGKRGEAPRSSDKATVAAVGRCHPAPHVKDTQRNERHLCFLASW